MEKNQSVNGFESLFNYFSKIYNLKTLFANSNISNKDKYQRLVAEIEQEVKERISAGKEKRINFDDFNQKLDEIISHVDKESEEYKVRKQNALMEVLSKNDELLKEKHELERESKEQSFKIKNLRVNVAKVAAMIGLFTFIPIASGAVGAAVGYPLGREEKKTTVTYNAKTREMIGEKEETYENLRYDYNIIVKECSPWVKGEYSDGYTREVLEYKYSSREEINIDKVLKTVEPKSYVETKKVLDSYDSTDQKEVIVTEITNDKNDYRIAPQSSIVLGVIFFLCGLAISTIISSDYVSYSDLSKAIAELRKAKIIRKEIKESYEKIGDKVVLLQTECQKDPDEYLELLDSISPELLKTTNKHR